MEIKKLIAAIAAPLAFVGLIGSMSVMPSSFAERPSAPAGVPGTTSSSVGTKPQCAWTLSGVEASVPLASTSGALYSGETLTITGSDADISATVSGGDCSWYEYKKGATITISTVDETRFTIDDPEDTTMDFDLTTSNPLTLDITHSCGPAFVSDTATAISASVVSAEPFSISKASTTTSSGCTYEMALGATVPSNKSPKNAGNSYVLVGPGLTTTLTLKD